MSISVKAATAVVAILVTAPAVAQVAGREGNQERRIIQGEHSGELTRGEAVRLQRQQNRIDRDAALDKARNGGALTPAERARLTARQNAASGAIYRDKHNDIVR